MSSRSFYKNQDKLISTLERVHRLHSQKDSDNEEDDDDERLEGHGKKNRNENDLKLKRKRISLCTKLSLFVNIVSLKIEREQSIEIFLFKGFTSYQNSCCSYF